MSDLKYIIGIDLGTTHCAMAYAPGQVSEGEEAWIKILDVPQVINPGEVKAQPLLPSFLFLPGSHDVPPGGLALPWDPKAEVAVGEFARKRGAEIPNRLISSAKSWLCHAGVNRTAPILPWDSPGDSKKLSPVDASAFYLKHLRDAWNFDMGKGKRKARFEDQELFLTVPASFDAVARELTMKAAEGAGFGKITLLEEPQSAFYAWIHHEKENWRKSVRVGESILVCDVGGGTTDFSLIQVTEEKGELALRRVAVGDHLLLGGDNMDLTLAYAVQAKLAKRGVKLDTWQFRGLWYACRVAKERLLGNPALTSEPVVVLGRGTSLIGGTLRTEVTREEVEKIILDGFFPFCRSTDTPQETPRMGMREMGLPYEPDPGVTRHLARFLGRQARQDPEKGAVPFPTAVLFNGGVMKADLIRKRVLDVLNGWPEAKGMRELVSEDLDLAVAQGAAYFGLARKGRGIRIRGGAARPYYIGIESALPSVPGFPPPMKALCVVPYGMEEGTEAEIRQKEFGLVIGEPAVFHLLASTVRKKDQAGEIIEDWQGEIEEVTTMEALLLAEEGEGKGQMVPVWLQSKITEIGTLELWCVSGDEGRRWKLEFNLREQSK